jgi:transcription initiation factor TFIIB
VKPKYGEPVAPNLNVRQICPNCREDPPNIVEEYSKGDLVCGTCGTILGDRIVDTRSECKSLASDCVIVLTRPRESESII